MIYQPINHLTGMPMSAEDLWPGQLNGVTRVAVQSSSPRPGLQSPIRQQDAMNRLLEVAES